MKIGELSKRAKTAVETIRFYEREDLLPQPDRTESNYRTYSEAHAQRLLFIRRCRSLDMTLEEIRTLLGFKDQPEQDCARINALVDAHIGHLKQRITELRGLEKQLLELRASCVTSESAQNCGILNGLSAHEQHPDRPVIYAGRAHVHGAHGR
jgi:Cd(II)/Pb(II)-responsive transcriptional regulator